MANWKEPTPETMDEWNEWLAERPPEIREMANRWPPWKMYKNGDLNQRVWPVSYSEDGTVTVMVSGDYNLVTHSRTVFGVDPNVLVECDLPGPDEDVGDMEFPLGLLKEMRAAGREEGVRLRDEYLAVHEEEVRSKIRKFGDVVLEA